MTDEHPHPPPVPGYSLFNVEANRRAFKELVRQHEQDRLYIAELEKSLQSLGAPIPKKVVPQSDIIAEETKSSSSSNEVSMKDGSLGSLTKSVNKIMKNAHAHEINVQFRNLTFWSSVPQTTIATVGSAVKSIAFGGGPKHRVNILKELTGRILPKTMTLLMGPPGCGNVSF